MSGIVPLFERINGLLVQVHPDSMARVRGVGTSQERMVNHTVLGIDILFTPEEEAVFKADQAEIVKVKAERALGVQLAKEARKTAIEKLAATAKLTPEELKAILE